MNHESKKLGFSLIEVLVGTALFLIVAMAFYGAFTSLIQLAEGSQSRTAAVQLADEQFEIIRNMPYLSVGLTNGIPQGILPQTQTVTRGGSVFTVNLTVRNINLSSSTVQASDRLVEVNIACDLCKDFQPITLTGQVSPANLQSAGTGGALVAQVLDANGQPVVDANVDVQSTATSSVQDHDVTNDTGVLNIIGVPAGNGVYHVSATKPGYSTDQTFPSGALGNPNPTKANATVLNQQVSQVSLAIDRLSSLHLSSVTPLCGVVPNMHFSLVGAKQIGLNLPKYSQNLTTNSSGKLDLSSMEWDTYTLTPTDSSYDLAGINPYSPFALNPNNSQNVQLVVVPRSLNSFMVSVQDIGTKLPVSGASVELVGPGGYDTTFITGQGYINQTDWHGGSGQTSYSDATRYAGDNGNVDVTSSPGNILMSSVLGSYTTNAEGTLESSTFDTGTSSNFYTISWTPINQDPLTGSTSVKLQFATSPSSTPATGWNYAGPDGTAATFFTVPGSSINVSQNGNEYARYMAYLTTNTATVTPIVSNVSFAYTSNCIPPGQAIFQGLTAGTYSLTISKSGYTTYLNNAITISSGWQQLTVPIGP